MKRSSGITKWLIFMALLTVVAGLAGCGSANKESGGGAGTTPVSDAANVGSDNCMVCHSSLTHTMISGIAGVNPSPTGLANEITHDCEACHGGGQYHFGAGPIPFPSPGGDRCAICHEEATEIMESKHNGEEPENVDMIAGGHDTGKCQRCHTAEGSRQFATIIGSKTAYDVIVNFGTAPTVTQVEALNNLDASGNHVLHNPVCGACHNSLTKELVSIPVGSWDPNGNGVSDQFDLCTSCHVYRLNDGTLIGSGLPLATGASTSPFYHDTAWFRVLLSTHFDNPATGFVGSSGETQSLIEGYVIREKSANPCFDCHGHNMLTNTGNLTRTGTLTGSQQGYVQDPTVEPTVHTDWAKSAHAGHLLKVKYAAQEYGDRNGEGNLLRNAKLTSIVTDSGTDDTTGIAWTHYNWDRSGRASCQRCHTSTGAMNFLNDPAGYNQNNNDFSHLAGWVGNQANGSAQNEMLYCWGCHSNAGTGVLRNPGALSFTYTNGATASYPDVAGSNVCMACHTGRETGDSVKLDTSPTGTRSFINSHYLAAGGTVFTTTGYEYVGRNYKNVTYYAHDQIGTANRPGTGTNGPCVGCHMSSEQGHLFLPVEKDEVTGDITAITATVCAVCHTGTYALTPTVLMDEEHEYAAALDVLKAALATKGMFFANSHPYFFVDTNGNNILEPGETTAFTNWPGPYGYAFWKDTMGAAFNANLLLHDPGGYAHNRYYAKGLIWDSIDFIDDGALNDSVPATIVSLAAEPDTLDTTVSLATATAAQLYLGNSRPGDASRIP